MRSKLPLLLAALALVQPSRAAADILYPVLLGNYGEAELHNPIGIAIGPHGESYVVSNFNGRIEKYSPWGSHVFGWGGHGLGPGLFDYPSGIAVDPNGDVLVLDSNADQVQ